MHPHFYSPSAGAKYSAGARRALKQHREQIVDLLKAMPMEPPLTIETKALAEERLYAGIFLPNAPIQAA